MELSHLNIHQDDIGPWMRIAEFLCQIVQSFLSIPHSADREVQLSDGFESDLLIDMTVETLA